MLCLRLSLAMGIPVDQIFSWPSELIQLYKLYWSVEPWGTHADDVRTAIVASTVYNCQSKKFRSVGDFKPVWWESRRKGSWEAFEQDMISAANTSK